MFARLVRPTSEDLDNVGLKGLYIHPPELFVIITKDGQAEKIDAIRFEEEKFGKMNYTSILQFLFVVNSHFRHDLPGINMAQNQQEAEMSDVIRIEEKRFEILRDSKDHVKANTKVEDDSNGFTFKMTKHVGLKDEL